MLQSERRQLGHVADARAQRLRERSHQPHARGCETVRIEIKKYIFILHDLFMFGYMEYF